MSKTLLITAFHSFVSKNILNSGVLARILEKPDIKIVLLVPENKKIFFVETYASDRISVEGVPISKIANYKKVKFFSYLSKLLLNAHYLWYKKVEKRNNKKGLLRYLAYFLEVFFTATFSRVPKIAIILRYVFGKSVAIEEARSLSKPDL
jgi:hypothetical protein